MANQTGSTKFATQERLAFLDIGSQLLFCVATLEQMLHLPHRGEVRVANQAGTAQFATRERLE